MSGDRLWVALSVVALWTTSVYADTSVQANATSSTDARVSATAKKWATFHGKRQLANENTAERTSDVDAQRTAWRARLDARMGKRPEKIISIYNTWTREYLSVRAVAPDGVQTLSGAEPIVPDEQVNAFLRCHFTNQSTRMDPRLIQTLVAAAVRFDVTRIDIISGFRSPKYNYILRKKGREVSRKSHHPKGSAVDFRLPGVSTQRLHSWAKRLRLGGVGRYKRSGFIHVDTGRVRYWDGT